MSKVTIEAVDVYIITDKDTNNSWRLATYELPNGRYVVVDDQKATVYQNFYTARKASQDLLEYYRTTGNFAIAFQSEHPVDYPWRPAEENKKLFLVGFDNVYNEYAYAEGYLDCLSCLDIFKNWNGDERQGLTLAKEHIKDYCM